MLQHTLYMKTQSLQILLFIISLQILPHISNYAIKESSIVLSLNIESYTYVTESKPLITLMNTVPNLLKLILKNVSNMSHVLGIALQISQSIIVGKRQILCILIMKKMTMQMKFLWN